MIALTDRRTYALITIILLCLAISGCQGEAQPRPVATVVAPSVPNIQAILDELRPLHSIVIDRERGAVGIVVGRDDQNRPLLMVPPGVYGGMRPDYGTVAEVLPGPVIQFGPGPADIAVDMGHGWVYLGDQPPAPDVLDPSRVQWLPHLYSRQGVIIEEPLSGQPWGGGGPQCQAGFELQVSIGGVQCLRLAPAATQGGPQDERTRAYALAIEPGGVLTNPTPADPQAPPPQPPYWTDPALVDLELHYDFNRDGRADLVVPSQGSAREPRRGTVIQVSGGPVAELSLIDRLRGFIDDLIGRLPLGL